MTTTTVTYSLTGDPTLLTSLTLVVVRTDTGVALSPAPVYVQDDATHWHATWTDPAPGLIYNCTRMRVYAGQSLSRNFRKYGGGDTFPRYLDLASAIDLAANVPGLAAWKAAASPLQYGALAMATFDLDKSGRWQGRKYDLSQALEFPRVAYQSSGSQYGYGQSYAGPIAQNALPGGDTIWDWDPVNKVAIVPPTVQLACLYQADSRVSGKRGAQLDKLYAGLKSQQTGGMSESYDLAQAMAASGGALALCREAAELMRDYALRSGRLL